MDVIVITGPTASGKSALAVDLARRLDTDIISADSRQIYRGIPIVTAVPSIEERGGVTHHLLETLPLDAYYSASQFRDDALAIISRLAAEGKDHVVVCGGSMMYVDALVYGIDELPTVPDDIRQGLTAEWRQCGDEWLVAELRRLDPVYAHRVDLRNLKRVFHAVEISLTARRPYSSLLTSVGTQHAASPRPDGSCVGAPHVAHGQLPLTFKTYSLDACPREWLFDRINRRVELMMAAGLLDEARRVYPLRHLNSLNTVGLKELFAYFDGTMDLPTAVARIQKNTRVYAKKQITWHKRHPAIIHLDPSSPIIL